MALIIKINGQIVPFLPVPWGHVEKTKAGIQRGRVRKVMSDGKWHTLADINAATGDPEASISRRLREFREKQHGGCALLRDKLDDGNYRYMLKDASN